MKNAGCAVCLVLMLWAPAYAKSAIAQRFDAFVRVEVGGNIEVTETLVFRFDGGSFTEIVRELPTRNSDGVEILDAAMDSEPVEFGEAAGQARVEGSARNRIRWRFAPLSDSTHTFVVRYLVRGAVRQDARGDLLVLRVPDIRGERRWQVESVAIEYELPPGVSASVTAASHRADAVISTSPGSPRVRSQSMGSNGWIETTLAMPAGSILSAAPAWQEAERQRAAYARLWLAGGAVAFVAGMILLFGLRQGYEPARHVEPGVAGPTPPDALPPSLAGALAARGRPSLEQAAAALLVLAERGDLRVEESDHHVLGRRTYHLTRRTSDAGPARHEEAVLAAMFKGRDLSVTLAKARTRLVRRFGSFSQAVLADLDAAGLLDHNRQRSRRSYLRLMAIEFVLTLAAFAAWPFLITAHGAWPLAIPGALAASAVVTLIAYATTTTPLTDEGVQRGRHWRAYRDYLKKVSRDKTGAMPAISLAYPIALGLASEWSKHLKKHPVEAPAWFHSSGGPSAYAAFIAAAGAGAHGNSPPHHAH